MSIHGYRDRRCGTVLFGLGWFSHGFFDKGPKYGPSSALQRPLKSAPLTTVSYSLFVPKKLVPGVNADTLRQRLAHIPLATSMGGQFRETLETGATKLGWPLKIVASCSSFTQAARRVLYGSHGGVLPGIARVDFDPSRILEIPLPFLKNYTRKLCVAWNPRLVEVRPIIARAVEALITPR